MLALKERASDIHVEPKEQECLVRFRIDGMGLTAATLAAFSFAFYNIGGHNILARYDRWRVLLYVLASAAAFWIVVNPPWKIAEAHYGRAEWLFLVVFAITSVLLPFSLYFAGLQHLDATERRWVEEMGGMNMFFVYGSGPEARIVTRLFAGST